ncbi:VCBS repeat-containing protein, partial [Candidatus Woesearchaeota archaeon]|nr:VCBS repeat-containing protein [Candidatus Woesearchaeota archaeon]
MIKNNKFLILLLLLIIFIPIAYSADDQYKPYLHKPNIPEHPKAKLYGKYSTNLFPGAATYSYPLEVPKGTNNLQPSLSISYNSQSMKQRPSTLGAGWSLTQNYVYRDVNFTPYNTTDDKFKLILNGASYDLIFDSNDNFYHTEIESFSRIQNLSNASNAYNQYWLATLKDGTQLRFGFNSDSELASNTGKGYALKWSLDRIMDVHNNKIFYSYREDPYSLDNGNQITYNNEQKRRIDFGYEGSSRPDLRLVYDQGNTLQEARRLNDIYIFFNSTLVRRYNFEYTNLNNESSLSSLNKIKHFGSDNSSLLHTITFGYYQPISSYYNSSTFNATTLFSDATEDFGVRLADLNNDGFVDIIQGRESGGNIKQAWLNNRTAFNLSMQFAPPDLFVLDVNGQKKGRDAGLRIADFNNDGLPDLLKGQNTVYQAWLNNGSSWHEDILSWPPPVSFSDFDGTDYIEQG